MHHLYLASQSPRRAELLTQLGITHELLLADKDEDAESLEAVHGREAPAAYVQRVTRLKLQAAVDRHMRRALKPAPILCADTTVALGRDILGKPVDAKDAARMLKALSGQTHRVHTVVGVAYKGTQVFALSTSLVTFANLSKQQIDTYIATGEPFGKAGAYAVQGGAAAFISKIRGSYSGIMGLPLFETAQLLRALRFSQR